MAAHTSTGSACSDPQWTKYPNPDNILLLEWSEIRLSAAVAELGRHINGRKPVLQSSAQRLSRKSGERRFALYILSYKQAQKYQLCWHLGASQGDIASLKGEDVDWQNSTISFTESCGYRTFGRLNAIQLTQIEDKNSASCVQ